MRVKDKYLNFYYETIGEVDEPKIDPKKTALLLVDLSKRICIKRLWRSTSVQRSRRMGEMDSVSRQIG